MGLAIWYNSDHVLAHSRDREALEKEENELEQKEIKAAQIARAFKERTCVEAQETKLQSFLLNECRQKTWIPKAFLASNVENSEDLYVKYQQQKDIFLDRLGAIAVPSGDKDMWDPLNYIRDPKLDEEFPKEYFVKGDLVLDLLRSPEGAKFKLQDISWPTFIKYFQRTLVQLPFLPKLANNFLTWTHTEKVPFIPLPTAELIEPEFLMALKARYIGPLVWLPIQEGQSESQFVRSISDSLNFDHAALSQFSDPLFDLCDSFMKSCQIVNTQLCESINPLYLLQGFIPSMLYARNTDNLILPSPIKLVLEYKGNPFTKELSPDTLQQLKFVKIFINELHQKEIASVIVVSVDPEFVSKWNAVAMPADCLQLELNIHQLF